MNFLLQRTLASIGLVFTVSLMAYIIYLIANVAASAVDEVNRSLVLTVTSVSIFGSMLLVSVTVGRLLDDGVETEF